MTLILTKKQLDSVLEFHSLYFSKNNVKFTVTPLEKKENLIEMYEINFHLGGILDSDFIFHAGMHYAKTQNV